MDNRYPTDSRDYSIEEPAPSAFTATYIARTLREYRGAIGLIMLAVVVGYLILAIAAYLLAPAVRVTSLPFRLEFAGAERGQYPNGTKFASSEIISTTVMLKTFRQNDLGRFTKFSNFVGSVFVVESNEAREALAREYQARLADTRLTSIDRERIQREYELKAGSLSKNQFSINYARRRRDLVPDAVAKKVLHDILKNWAEWASTEKHVLKHRVAVLSPDVVASEPAGTRNPIVRTIILRGNVARMVDNIRELNNLPNAELSRTRDGLSLNDISARLEDLVRYRLDPLVNRIAVARIDDRDETLRFMAAQLAYDERVLKWRRDAANTAQRTLSLYINAQPQISTTGPATTTAPGADDPVKPAETTLMPQISDTFIDRLIQLTSQTADTDFRQRLARDYQHFSLAVAPTEAAVAYDLMTLETLRNATGPAASSDAAEIEREIVAMRADARQYAIKLQELHKIISESLNSSTELLTVSTPQTRVNRGISAKTLILLGILISLVGLVLAVLLSLFHSRVRAGAHERGGVATPAEGAA